MACLFLSGKVEERRTRVDTVLESYFTVKYEEAQNHFKKNPAKFPNPKPKPQCDSQVHNKIQKRKLHYVVCIVFSIFNLLVVCYCSCLLFLCSF